MSWSWIEIIPIQFQTLNPKSKVSSESNCCQQAVILQLCCQFLSFFSVTFQCESFLFVYFLSQANLAILITVMLVDYGTVDSFILFCPKTMYDVIFTFLICEIWLNCIKLGTQNLTYSFRPEMGIIVIGQNFVVPTIVGFTFDIK